MFVSEESGCGYNVYSYTHIWCLFIVADLISNLCTKEIATSLLGHYVVFLESSASSKRISSNKQ